MIIHPLTPRLENGELVVSARIEWDKPENGIPRTLWFKLPESQAHLVSEHADGFAIALLAPALARGEDIYLRGSMSSALAHGIQEYIHLQTLRLPHRYKPMQVHADAYEQRRASGSKAASSFSGGVDSFYTVWSHIPQNEPFAGNALSYAIFVQGFDIALNDQHTFDECRLAYGALMQAWGVELVPVRTNVRYFDKPLNWLAGVTFAVIGLGHLLGRELARFYIPSNFAYEDFPHGALLTLPDELLSSESLRFVADGARFSRFEKMQAVAHIPAAYDHLRICSARVNGLTNCCRCGRCLNSMVALELAGTLQNFKTFPLPLDRGKLRLSPLDHEVRQVFTPYVKGALAQRRYDLAFDLYIKLGTNYLNWGRKWVRDRIRRRQV